MKQELKLGDVFYAVHKVDTNQVSKYKVIRLTEHRKAEAEVIDPYLLISVDTRETGKYINMRKTYTDPNNLIRLCEFQEKWSHLYVLETPESYKLYEGKVLLNCILPRKLSLYSKTTLEIILRLMEREERENSISNSFKWEIDNDLTDNVIKLVSGYQTIVINFERNTHENTHSA